MNEIQQSFEKTGIRANSNQQLLNPHHKQAKKVIMSISFSALIFYIIFILVSLLNISPSILFKDTKFWFFISNAIVVIIAVDSGAFSSSRKGNHDLYEEYMMKSKTRNTTTSSSLIAKSTTKTCLKKKPMILLDSEMSISYDKPMIFNKANSEAPQDAIELGDRGHIAARYDRRAKLRYNRSNSEKSIAAVSNEDKRVLARSKTKNYDNKFEEEDEFSAMSDEELNKRVEEFIERFNRQIRLQDRTL